MDRLDLDRAVRLTLEVKARAYQTEVHSSQVDQGANQVEVRLGCGVENAGCPSHARRRGAVCFAEPRTSEAVRLAAQRPVWPLVLRVAPARSLAPAGDVWHEALDPHRRVVNGGLQGNPGSQYHGHRERKQTLPTLEPPSWSVRAKGYRAVGK